MVNSLDCSNLPVLSLLFFFFPAHVFRLLSVFERAPGVQPMGTWVQVLFISLFLDFGEIFYSEFE